MSERALSPRSRLLITIGVLVALALVVATAWVLFDRWREKRVRELTDRAQLEWAPNLVNVDWVTVSGDYSVGTPTVYSGFIDRTITVAPVPSHE